MRSYGRMGDVGDVGSMGVRLWIIDGLGLEDGGGLGGDGEDGRWVGVFFSLEEFWNSVLYR